MKKTLIILGLSLFVILSCKKKDNPVDPGDRGYMQLINYGVALDSFYYKEWSDNSWEQFNAVYNINGVTYTTIINSQGDEFYYSDNGYSGFKLFGDSLIIFDHPLESLPDSIAFDQTYTSSTTFTYEGNHFTYQYDQVLKDTVTLSLLFGEFNGCLLFKTATTLAMNGAADTDTSQSWIAVGPGDIKFTSGSGSTKLMTKGIVNGIGWGMPFPKVSSGTYNNKFYKPVPFSQMQIIKSMMLRVKGDN